MFLGQCQLSNVNQYISWSNRLSHIVASEIVSCQKVSDRVEMIEFFMDAALICCRLGNFNSCVSLTAGLSLPVIQRLTKTWARIEDTKLRVLQHICDPVSNFRNYRVILKMFESENTTPVLVPMFAVFLKDCFFRLKPCVDSENANTDRQLQVRVKKNLNFLNFFYSWYSLFDFLVLGRPGSSYRRFFNLEEQKNSNH